MTNNTSATEHRFVICIRNDGYPTSLEVRKLYQVSSDADAASRGFIRVIDESGEGYLYPKDCFLMVELPPSVEDALLAVA
jgi:hypothetical protein